VVGLGFVAYRVERLIPGRQDLACGDIDVTAGVFVPLGQVAAVVVDFR